MYKDYRKEEQYITLHFKISSCLREMKFLEQWALPFPFHCFCATVESFFLGGVHHLRMACEYHKIILESRMSSQGEGGSVHLLHPSTRSSHEISVSRAVSEKIRHYLAFH